MDSYFNSRPSARGDAACGGFRHPGGHFNSRPSARGDGAGRLDRREGGHFNSRPSARGDAPYSSSRPRRRHFNSRPSARGDDVQQEAAKPTAFQFTSLREGRRKIIELLHLDMEFQFTSLREGRRLSELNCLPTRSISIHVPPRGATRAKPELYTQRAISIHVPPRGATSCGRCSSR